MHPNLSPDINANLLRLELNGGINVDSLPVGSIVEVQTSNTLYRINKLSATEQIIGHAKYCPTWRDCYIAGSTWGGSMIVARFIGNGMHLEFHVGGRRVTTSAIRSVKVL